MAETRNRYDREFKLEAVKMVLEQGISKIEVGRRLGVHPTSIGNWIKAFQADEEEAFPGKGKLKPRDEELRRLRREVEVLRMERDFLKKTAAYFAKDQK